MGENETGNKRQYLYELRQINGSDMPKGENEKENYVKVNRMKIFV